MKAAFNDERAEHEAQRELCKTLKVTWGSWIANLAKRERERLLMPRKRRRNAKNAKGARSETAGKMAPCRCGSLPLRVEKQITLDGIVWTVVCVCDEFDYPGIHSAREVLNLWNNGNKHQKKEKE